jgi:hypothetical protein
MSRKVFYSFHYANDVFRVQQIRNIGAIEDNKPVSVNKWEEVKQGGSNAIKKWIDDNMSGRTCLVVLVGEETSKRKWVKYEIEKAWEDGMGVLGIYIHNLNCLKNGYCSKGQNPFEQFTVGGKGLSSVVKCYNPSATNTYNDIRDNIENWIEEAIAIRRKY